MNISKISRSIIVVIFVNLIIFLGYLDISLLLEKVQDASTVTTNVIKLVYGIAILILVLIYIYIKDRLYQMKVKRNISFIYRYIYIGIIGISTSLLSINKIIDEFSVIELVLYTLVMLATAIIVKRIIFNVSRSDMLSMFGMIMCSFLPNALRSKTEILVSMTFSLAFFVVLIILQVLIDELKQRGIKTKKYLVLTLLLGVSIGINIVFGINYIVFAILAIAMVFITINLDNTHINFPRKFMSSLTKENREKCYKIERINISKLAISIVACTFVAYVTFTTLNILVKKVANKYQTVDYVQNISQNLEKNDINGAEYNFASSCMYIKDMVAMSKTYNLVIFIYILLLEILAFILKRRYDTKSTSMKILFITIILLCSFIKLNIYFYQPLLTILLIIIAIVNTSNIYLNREERIKMLVA